MSEALQQVLGPAPPTSVGVLLVGVGVLLAGLGILFQGVDHLVGARHKLSRAHGEEASRKKSSAVIARDDNRTLEKGAYPLIKNVQIVSVPVSDQGRAKSFYVDAL
jgi:hypothetical protein